MIGAAEGCSKAACAILVCFLSWAKSVIARELMPRLGIPRGSKFLINGEPTENRLALASKGVLRYEVEATASSRTPPIPNWANPPSKSFWTPSRKYEK